MLRLTVYPGFHNVREVRAQKGTSFSEKLRERTEVFKQALNAEFDKTQKTLITDGYAGEDSVKSMASDALESFGWKDQGREVFYQQKMRKDSALRRFGHSLGVDIYSFKQ